MRVLVTGARGQLGSEFVTLLGERGDEVLGVDMPGIDITEPGSVATVFDLHEPEVVINCAAWTAVDAAEENEAAALKVNGDGVRVLAEACARTGAWLVQISTDYVFAGDAASPYAEGDAPDPRTAYGRTKLAGELAAQEVLPDAHYLVRTAWLYGVNGNNFVKTILGAQRKNDVVKVVTDQVGQPTYARDLARQIIALLDARPAAGTFHGTNAGVASWYEFTQAIFDEAGIDASAVEPTDSSGYVRPAPRPAYSVLGHDRWREVGLEPMRDWRAALTDAFADGIDRP